MKGHLLRTLMLVVVFSLVRPAAPVWTAAAPGQVPAAPDETGVYTEDFTTYTAKGYTDKVEWDIWAHTLHLQLIDGTSQADPAMARDGSDNIIMVWQDFRSGNGDIYAQKVDVDGSKLWAADVRVDSDSGIADQGTPAVVVDGSGNAIVVWADERNGNSDIYAQKLDGGGNRVWAADVRVDSDSGTATQRFPAMALDGSGDAIVVWGDYRNGNGDIYAQRLDGSGSRLWVSDRQVNSDSGTAWQDFPTVAVDGNGAAVVAWEDRRGGRWDIYAQRLDEDGDRLWAGDVCVNFDTGTAGQHWPAVAVDGSGNAVVVWIDERNGTWDVYAQRLDGSGNRLWGGDGRVNFGSGMADHCIPPAVAVDGGGNAIVVWEDKRDDRWDIYAQKLDGGGSRLWAADVRVKSNIGTAGDWSPPSVVVGRNGNAAVAWKDSRNGKWDIYAQELDGSGNPLWAADVRINSDNGTADQQYPDVAVDGSRNAFVVWGDLRNGDRDIYLQKLDGSGNRLWAADVRVNSDSSTKGQYRPAVAVDADGNAAVVWEDYRSGNGDIYVQRFDGNGNRLWVADVRVNSDGGIADQQNPTVAVDGNGNVVIVWQDQRDGGGDIYVQKLDAGGHLLWVAEVRVNSDSGTAWQDHPAVALDGNANAIVLWMDDRNGHQDIYAQKLDRNGNRLWAAEVRVNSDGGTAEQQYPAVAVDGSGNAVIAWEDWRSGNGAVYAQKLDGSGSKLWAADVRVNSESVTAGEWSPPTIGVDGSGNAVVTWKDERGGSDGIYAQRLDRGGSRLWGTDVRVNSGGGMADRWSPAVAVDGSGSAVVAWTDERDNGRSIYAQRINTVGGKAWLADLRVACLDRFYFRNGTVQSRTVDGVAGNVRNATIMVDYQANGGGVQFYLTNSGGSNWFSVIPGVTHVFTTAGSDLRWRAVLTADPLWPRTPVVNSLRIEYSTQSPYADNYEGDDTCVQARAIGVNGASQAHTFHQRADADWVWFDVISSTTYIVQTANPQANADTTLELRRTCPQPPLKLDDNAFGREARITWQATFSGTVYAKVANHDAGVYGPETGYDLSVRTFVQAPVAVIVGGHDDVYTLQANIDYAGDMAYRTFLNSGVPKANIRYFSPNPDRDVDGNGLHDDIYATVTITDVREAVQDWPRERGVQLGVPFYVYLVDHGHYDQFLAEGAAHKVWAADLDLWLSNLEATSGADNINVILEACHSGSFIDVTALGPAEVSGRNRVVIASTSSGLNAYASLEGAYFSDVFWTGVGQNQDLKTAFERGKQAVQATGLSQQPWLDDNGDAVADGRDGALARSRGLSIPLAGRPPAIDWMRVGPVSGGQATIQAQVRDDFGVSGVWVEVYAPGFEEPEPTVDGTMPVLDVPTRTLALVEGDLFGVTYDGFTQTGEYRLVVYAQDGDGNQALPQVAETWTWRVYLPLVIQSN